MVARSQSHQVSIIDDIMMRQGSSFRIPRGTLKKFFPSVDSSR
jgi:hypothetical protein